MEKKRVKLEISSDLEDVTKTSACLLEESFIHIRDLNVLISSSKDLLKETNIQTDADLNKLRGSLQGLNLAIHTLTKINNRLLDVTYIVDGLHKLLTQPAQINDPEKIDDNDDTVSTR